MGGRLQHGSGWAAGTDNARSSRWREQQRALSSSSRAVAAAAMAAKWRHSSKYQDVVLYGLRLLLLLVSVLVLVPVLVLAACCGCFCCCHRFHPSNLNPWHNPNSNRTLPLSDHTSNTLPPRPVVTAVHGCAWPLSAATHGCARLKLKAALGCAHLTTISEKSSCKEMVLVEFLSLKQDPQKHHELQIIQCI